MMEKAPGKNKEGREQYGLNLFCRAIFLSSFFTFSVGAERRIWNFLWTVSNITKSRIRDR